MTAARNSTSQSPAGRPARSLLIGATLLAVATILAAWQDTTAAAEKRKETTRPRQILLDARVVTMKPRYRSQLGTWQKVTLADDDSAVSPAARTRRTRSNRPIEAQVLTTDDLASTESLTARIQALEEDGRLHIVTNPQLIVEDGDDALLRTIRQEWWMITVPRTYGRHSVCGGGMPGGPSISMTIHVGDSNDITLATAFEDSDRRETEHPEDHDSEIIKRRTETHAVKLVSGGTMAWVDLVPCDSKDERPSGLGRMPVIGGLFRSHQAAKRTRETVIFVTAYLVPESPAIVTPAQE